VSGNLPDARFRTIIEHSFDIILLLRRDGSLAYASPSVERTLGHDLGELIDTSFVDLAHEDDREVAHTMVRDLLAEPARRCSGELRLRHNHGHHCWFEGVATNLLHEPTIGALVVNLRETRDRNAADEERTQHTEQLRALADAAVAITSAPRIEERLDLITATARRIIGAHVAITHLRPREEAIPRILTASLSDKYASACGAPASLDLFPFLSVGIDFPAPFRANAEELQQHPGWQRLEPASKPPLPDCLAAPLVGGGGEALGWIQLSDKLEGEFGERDQSLLVQLAQFASVAVENAWLYEDAEHAVRARDRVTAVVSHDLRSPLNAISIIANLLLQPGLPEARRSEYAVTIKRSAEQMRSLIQDLLNLGLIEDGSLTVCPVAESAGLLMQEAVARMRPQAEWRGVRIDCAVEADLPNVLADRDRALDVFANLIANAIRSSPEGGTIRTAVQRLVDRVRFSVTDDGPGMATNQLPYVFDVYWRRPETAPREASLGLAVARGLVKAHGGEIWVESREGAGSTFFVSLPLAADALPSTPEKTPAGPARNRSA
jgi:PAS domain S-box-containing protein